MKSGQQSAIAILCQGARSRGSLEVVNGDLAGLRLVSGQGKVAGNKFTLSGPARIELRIGDARVEVGANPTTVRVKAGDRSFAFFVRDVRSDSPIFIPIFGMAVTPADDRRTYDEIAEAVHARGLQSSLAAIESAPEQTYEDACRHNRKLMCPTWLGLSRDMRFFEVGYSPQFGYWGYVQPRYHSTNQSIPETQNKNYQISFALGPGASCRVDITRRLEEGFLPILKSTQREDDVHYNLTAFATLESGPLRLAKLRGSPWDACYPNTGGNMLSAEDKKALSGLLEAEMRNREEETVCWLRVDLVNTGRVPRYAWFTVPGLQPQLATKLDRSTGFGQLESGRVFAISRLDGRPVPDREMAVLLQPGETKALDLLIPHQPIPASRAKRLARQDFSTHLDACREFWRAKLRAGASISVPEPAIDERIKAGLLHCDIVALGKEPDEPVLATIGWYSPIGSESSPIIQFFDSMGWHKLAQRSLEFFLARQRADGFIQNFGGYQLETGPALWSMGEHYRYTRDVAWVRRIRPKLLKACDYLLAWRDRNKKPGLRGRGYGLQDGKVADPQDFFHSFMLNGLSYAGISRVAEMLAKVDPPQARRLAREARAYRKDIRTAFYEAIGRSPVIPLGDGTWTPTVPPWAEYSGPLALYADGGQWHTHGAFGSRDTLIGSLYLVIGEVLEPDEIGTEIMLKSHQQLFTVNNAALSQPYYVRHDYIHAARGEVKPFLATYYNQFSALQDRETYTFWEHYFHASQHKTHEEGWFLMQTRWMLYMEMGDTLSFLRAIPRRWLADGQRIELANVATHFGPASLRVESRLAEGLVSASIACDKRRGPRAVTVRLPHPDGRKARRAEGGTYDAATETVRVAAFKGKAEIRVWF